MARSDIRTRDLKVDRLAVLNPVGMGGLVVFIMSSAKVDSDYYCQHGLTYCQHGLTVCYPTIIEEARATYIYTCALQQKFIVLCGAVFDPLCNSECVI